MNSSIYRFTLGMNSSQSQISIPVLLGDTGREWHINLSDGGKPYIITDGCLAKLSIKRPTGTRLEEFCTIDDNTTIVYKFTQNENTCAVEGIHDCDVTLYGLDGKVITMARFTMVVSERAINSDDIIVTDEDFTAVDAMLKAEESRQVAESNRVEAEVERSEAEAERVANEEERKENAMLFKESVEQAVEAKAASKASAESAKASETNAKTSETKATNASNVATAQAQSAIESASASASSATEAKEYMEVAQGIANDSVNMDARIILNSKRITNLEQGLPSEQFMTDSTVAHVKDVPVNALPYAEVSKVGGMTRKCTNLIPYPYRLVPTSGGATFVVNSDLSIDVSGTPSQSIYETVATLTLEAGTYCLTNYGDMMSTVRLYATYDDSTIFANNSFTLTKQTSVRIRIAVYDTFDGKTVRIIPMFNEGSTALPYEPYYEGLRDAKVTEIESVGANLWNATWEQGDIDASSGIENTLSTLIRSDFVRVFPDATYTIKRSITVDYIKVRFYDKDKNFIGSGDSPMYEIIRGHTYGNPMQTGQASFVATITNPQIAYIRIVDTSNNLSTVYSMYLGNYNEADIPEYSPYTRNSLPVPEAVQALDGYGWGVNADCYNYIDWDKKQFVKRVGSVDLGTLNWVYSNCYGTGVMCFRVIVNNVKPNGDMTTPNVLCALFDTIAPVAMSRGIEGVTIFGPTPGITICTSQYTDAATFKAAMQGVMLYYELATPEVTDISDLLSADNFLAVEGGGTVTAVNEYGYDVQSEITYMLKETTV